MCDENSCCCKNSSPKGLQKYLFTFAGICAALSFISVLLRASDTKRYKEALVLLDERNKYGLSNYAFTSDDCRKGGFLNTEMYCKINGEMLSKPEKNVSYQSLFKNFKKGELAMGIIRTIITGAFLLFINRSFSNNLKFF